MSLEVERTADPRLLRVVGEVDLHNVGTLTAALDEARRTPGDLTLDLSRMEFIDSTGISALLRTFRALAEGGDRLILRAPIGPVRELFNLLGLSHSGVVVEEGDEASV